MMYRKKIGSYFPHEFMVSVTMNQFHDYCVRTSDNRAVGYVLRSRKWGKCPPTRLIISHSIAVVAALDIDLVQPVKALDAGFDALVM